MPLFNRNFTKGKMNKDLDERLVPAGEYRDALNVEVSTSEASNVGALQTVRGNVELTSGAVPDGSYCVGSIINNEENAIYYLVAGADRVFPNGDYTRSDYIIRYNIDTSSIQYVFVDTYEGSLSIVNSAQAGEDIYYELTSRKGLKTRDRVSIYDAAGNFIYNSIIKVYLNDFDENNPNGVIVEGTVNNAVPQGATLDFTSDRLLKFQQGRLITGINIIDDMLFFTDNANEPKKINITRSLLGTGGPLARVMGNGEHADLPTRLVSEKPESSVNVEGLQIYGEPHLFAKEQDITVIRKNPNAPPTLKMSATAVERLDEEGNVNPTQSTDTYTNGAGFNIFGGDETASTPIDTQTVMAFTTNTAVDWRVGDIIIGKIQEDNEFDFETQDADIRLQIVEPQLGSAGLPPYGPTGNGLPNPENAWYATVLSRIDEWPTDFTILLKLELEDPLFEFKFPRFAYRYKYIDGEYSAFSPFSEVAFLPGAFRYNAKQGYNLGMANRIRKLTIENYLPKQENRCGDIVEVDILYKEEGSTTVYTVETIKPTYASPQWSRDGRGAYEINSELIHAVVPSNQLIRPYDNVPRVALAQEVTANRVVYGNYLNNYDIRRNLVEDPFPVRASLNINSKDIENEEGVYFPQPSVKTMRKYQLGVVYRDEYGRETPVLTANDIGTLDVPKRLCTKQNYFQAEVLSPAPYWAKSFKFFIKETSNEYYNLAMDRWYNAQDGNVWISFPSSERNKVDIDTFLELKKGHDVDDAVIDPARYKILAIENEAPEYIKITRRPRGKILNNATGTHTNAQNESANSLIGSIIDFPTEGGNTVSIQQSVFEQAFGATGDTGPSAQEILEAGPDASIRFTNLMGERSNYYRIRNINQDPEDQVGFYQITIEGQFKEDVIDIMGDPSGDGAAFWAGVKPFTQLEIVVNVKEDRPEFDGRFFVKIYKDLLLEQYILNSNEDDLIPVFSMGVSYLATYKSASGGGLIRGGGYDYVAGRSETTGITDFLESTGMFNTDNTYYHPWGYDPNNDGVAYKWGDNALVGSDVYGHDFAYTPILWQQAGISNDFTTGEFNSIYISGNGTVEYDETSEEDDPENETEALSSFLGPLFQVFSLGNIPGLILAPITLLASQNPGIFFWNGGASGGKGREWWHKHFHGPFGEYPRVFIDDAWASDWNVIADSLPDSLEYGDNDSVSSKNKNVWSNGHKSNVQVGFVGDNSPILGGLIQALAGAFGVGEREHDDASWGASTQGSPLNMPAWASNGSQGIRGNRIDISVTNLGPGWPDKNDGYEESSSMKLFGGPDEPSPGAHMTVKELLRTFFTYMQSPGIKFRFRSDPDREVYTVKRSASHWGITNSRPYKGNNSFGFNTADQRAQYATNRRNKFTIEVNKQFGMGPSGWLPTANMAHDGSEDTVIQVLGAPTGDFADFSTDNPGIFETYPKEDIGLDIYYEISRAYPVTLSYDNDETLALKNSLILAVNGVEGAVNCTITKFNFNDHNATATVSATLSNNAPPLNGGSEILIEDNYGGQVEISTSGNIYNYQGELRIAVDPRINKSKFILPWFNCYAFGNGVESDRIRDDFNQPTIQNGVKASTVLAEQYKEERRGSGLIYSGIYNSRSGVNRLNQFIAGEKITKDLNPDNGTIQKLFSRYTNLLAFCEDKVLKILSNKDALFNADGNSNVTATERVLGAVTPFEGEYGISKNPESFAADNYRCYFADKQRGAVLRLSGNGITAISDYGMKDYFTDLFKIYTSDGATLYGSFDGKKDEYNLSVTGINSTASLLGPLANKGAYKDTSTTISFCEPSNGWVSFKSFIPESAVDINNEYYTFNNGSLYIHHKNPSTALFYGNPVNTNTEPYVSVIINDAPSSDKGFQTIKYEGSQAKVVRDLNLNDPYYAFSKTGWYLDDVKTDLQQGSAYWFKKKESFWFSYLRGEETTESNVDTCEFSVQGIGNPFSVEHSSPDERPPRPIRVTVREAGGDIDGTNWEV